MSTELTPEQEMIQSTAKNIAEDFGPEYWREKEERGEYSYEFQDALAENGFYGIVTPEEYGGSGFGMEEAVIAMETLCREGTGYAGAEYVFLHGVMTPYLINHHGTDAQKQEFLPKIAEGELKTSWGITEPNAGSNTLRTETTAEKDGDEYVINGQKIFTSWADISDAIVLVTRTAPYDAGRKSDGISIFIADQPDDAMEIKKLKKHGINYSNINEVFIDDLRVPDDRIIGGPKKEGDGWTHLISGLNPERLGVSAGVIGTGELALETAAQYANERAPFGDPIGSYQGIQFPLAEAKVNLEASRALMYKAASLFDQDKKCALEANAAKFTAVESSIEAVYHAMQTHGGYGYVPEYDVERWWREVNLLRLGPVSQQMVLNFVAQHALDLPRSY